MQKPFFALSALAVGLMLAAGCNKKPSENTPNATTKHAIAVIPKGTTHEFWKSINAGAVKAQRELSTNGTKVEIIWKGPLREDDRVQQIQVVENFMALPVIKGKKSESEKFPGAVDTYCIEAIMQDVKKVGKLKKEKWSGVEFEYLRKD